MIWLSSFRVSSLSGIMYSRVEVQPGTVYASAARSAVILIVSVARIPLDRK
jgi:hypothetical protein